MSLVFSALASLDGYTVDTSGSFDWAAPDEEVHAAVNDRERGIGTYLYGRRMFETMRVWQGMGGGDAADVIRDYADIWRAADKIVYSSSLTGVTTPRTTIEPVFDPAAVRALVEAAPGDVSVGGPTLAAEAFRAGLVDVVELYLAPVSVGGGLPALPPDLMLDLELLEERSFRSGTVMLRYRVSSPAA
ncbi:dihydrofolate reductase family protein [Leifsonia shinshuensis]|uniref:Dihydrofolate reductase family protein n=1 Tax=Leifsonia shinshuensis TaxID=150026 RepID=A0A7G6YCF4_9MICO|nr:dihydrofolate reductase family protein [Leifsonia shinshuensis]QNE36169.1 dihydrofolate reductase family protein [Leifsonia shinshuensis]